MENKGVQYSVAQAKGRWHWMVYLPSGLKTGSARFRTWAILTALNAIRKSAAAQKKTVAGAAIKPKDGVQ
jgi:hypothetical protein